MTDTATITAAPTSERVHDARRFWQILLAVVTPLPMVSKGIAYLLIPVDGNADVDTTVDALRPHPTLADTLVWLDVVFCVLLVPSVVAACWLARRGAPRLTTAAALVAGGGTLVGQVLLGGPLTPYQMVLRHDLDRGAMSALSDAAEEDTVFMLGALCFIAGIVIGLTLLGLALWRSRAVPWPAAWAVVVGGATHPFLPGHTVQGIGLLVAAAGFAWVAAALLRLPRDAFDLPPSEAV